jgi:hypothetical protein
MSGAAWGVDEALVVVEWICERRMAVARRSDCILFLMDDVGLVWLSGKCRSATGI